MANNTDELDLNDIQALFYQVVALLGASLFIYMYINFRNNRKKKITSTAFDQPKKQNTNQTSEKLKEVIDLIPYPACIADEKQKVIIFNKKYESIVDSEIILKNKSWDKQLQIDNSKLNLSNNGEVIATNSNNKSYKLAIKPLEYDNIDLQLYYVIVEDITNTDYIQSDVEQRKSYLKNTIAKASFPIVIIDKKLKVIEANKHFGKITKSSRSSLLNQSFLHLFSADEQDNILNHISNKSDNYPTQSSYHILSKEKQLIPIELDTIPFNFFGTDATICFLKDISVRSHMENEMRKAKRRAEESDRLKSSFLANMSHEVRTPLNSIMGFTELMSDEQLSAPERKEFHNIVKASSNELLSLLNDIMEFSKIESGLIKLHHSSISPHDIINEISEYAKSQISKNNQLQFIIKEPIGLGQIPTINSDKNRVKQVLRHLIDNAIKFTYTGSITLSYQFRIDNSIEFIVSDTGIGIPQKKIPNIFHKFRQANDDNSRDFGGAGLGLSICRHLANVLGGFLWVSSIEHRGSDFHFILPATSESAQAYRYNNCIVFYSKTPQPAPFNIDDTKSLLLYSFQALLNVPMAHNVSCILLNNRLSDDEMALLMAIPQVQSSTIVLYNKKQSEIIYSPFKSDIHLQLNSDGELKKYLTKCIEIKISD